MRQMLELFIFVKLLCNMCVERFSHFIHFKLSCVSAGRVRQPVCQINSSVQWDRSTQLCKVKERSAAA